MKNIKNLLDTWKNHLNDKTNLINELDTRRRKDIKDEIQMAESGRFPNRMPFNDIFGVPTEQDPKLRFILPFGNPDIDKLKHILAKIRKKAIESYQYNPNIERVNLAVFDIDTQNSTQDVRPLGWQQGDPLQKIEKAIGNIIFDLEYVSSKGEKKERREKIPFSTMLKKYSPEDFDWWQGSKGQTGKYLFFTHNPDLLDSILSDLGFNRSKYEQEMVEGSSGLVIASRHPIDVIRMSDFKNIKSCHTPGSSHWDACRQEVKEIAGGGVLFTIKQSDFDKLFPDGNIPQKGDIFNDTDVNINNMLPNPDSRLRLRRIVFNQQKQTQIAVPDTRIYGLQNADFKKEIFNFFAEKQKEKFLDDNGTPIPIEKKNLQRFGGEYEDGGSYTVGNNFLTLYKQVIKQNPLEFKGIENEEWFTELESDLDYYSIAHYGDPVDPEEDDCEPLLEAQREIDARNDLDYTTFMTSVECDNEPPFVSITAAIQVLIPIKNLADDFVLLNGQKETDLKRFIERNDYLYDVANVRFSYPDLDFNDISLDIDNNNLSIRLLYDGTAITPGELESYYDDFVSFEKKVSIEDIEKAIIMSFMELGWYKATPLSSRYQEIYNFSNWVDKQENFSSDVNKHKVTFTYEKLFKTLILQENNMLITSYDMRDRVSTRFTESFNQLIKRKTSQYFAQLSKQQPMFSNIEPSLDPSEEIQTRLFNPKLVIQTGNYIRLTDEQQKNSFVKFSLKLEINIDMKHNEEEVTKAMDLVEAIVENNDIVDDVAHKALNKVLDEESIIYENINKQKIKRLLREWYRRNK